MSRLSLDFTDKVVLITGAATGIGRATAQAFAANGARVVIGDIDDRADETGRLITEAGGEATFLRTDVTSDEDVAALVKAAVDTYGGLHVAVNNAGLLPPTAPLTEQTVEDFDKVIAIDLKGVSLSLKHEITHMAAHGGGAIVNTASIAGVIADPGMAPYVAAKHGVVGLTRAAAGGGFRVGRPKEAARAVTTLCVAVAQWYRADGPLSPEQLAAEYVDLVQAMVRADGAR